MLNAKKAKYVKAKAQGKSNRSAGLEAGASTVVAADQYAQRMSKDVEVVTAIQQSLIKHNLTIDRALHNIDLALDATDPNDNPNHAVRLQATDRVLKLHESQLSQDNPINTEHLLQALKTKDTVEITKAVFSKSY